VKVDDMGKLFAGFPRLLSYSVDRKLQPVVEFLASSGIKSEDIGRVVTRCPQLFCYSLEARLRPVLEFLKSIGVQEGGLAKVVLRAPHVLSRNVETVLKPAYESLIDMGFSPDKVRGGRQALAAAPMPKDCSSCSATLCFSIERLSETAHSSCSGGSEAILDCP
jgi:hypothetical protein